MLRAEERPLLPAATKTAESENQGIRKNEGGEGRNSAEMPIRAASTSKLLMCRVNLHGNFRSSVQRPGPGIMEEIEGDEEEGAEEEKKKELRRGKVQAPNPEKQMLRERPLQRATHPSSPPEEIHH